VVTTGEDAVFKVILLVMGQVQLNSKHQSKKGIHNGAGSEAMSQCQPEDVMNIA